MARPRIKTALIGCMLLLGVCFAVFAAFAVDRLEAINENVTLLATDSLQTALSVKDMEVQLGDIRTSYRSHILRADPEGKSAAAATIDKAFSKLKTDIVKFEGLAPSSEETGLVREIEKSVGAYLQTGQRVLALSSAGDIDQANKVLREEMVQVADLAKAAMSRLVEIANSDASAAYSEASSAYRATLAIAFVAIGLTAAVIVGSIWFAITGIAKPIQIITEAMNTLAAGNADTAVPFAGRSDEIGQMAAAVEVFRQNAVENGRLEEEAKAHRALNEEQRHQAAEKERVRAAQMSEATAGLASGLKHLAAGNLAFALTQPFAADFESLRADFNTMANQLRETLSAVAQSTSTIDGGSREVSKSADDLSKRTEQQAASLEQTAAALDQITVNVTNSSRRAEEARTVAIQANESARQSGDVVAKAVQAMGLIEESSSQISNIISVIDDIAFQTNLLALNAGVEAARAGEAGKGFAVVAQEVRELAQRSAQAAKEIKELIGKSSIEVGTGVKLVRDTGEALRVIEAHIVTINQHMDSIATSSREQSVGLSEVNTAVNQMDQVTQQNAAMVEETSAAGATLASEAGRLRELVSQFQLGGPLPVNETSSLYSVRSSSSLPSTMTTASPARSMVHKVAKAFRARSGSAAAADPGQWEEF